MKPRRVASRVRGACRAAALLSLTLTAACGSLATEGVQTTTLNPDYRATIAKRLHATFNKTPLSGPIEISDPRWVQANKGWGWMVCIRFQDRGHQRTYVMILDHNEFLDERYAVQTDACGAQTYSGLDVGSGSMRPGSVGEPGPLY